MDIVSVITIVVDESDMTSNNAETNLGDVLCFHVLYLDLISKESKSSFHCHLCDILYGQR